MRPGLPSGKENIAPQPQTLHGAVPLALTTPGKMLNFDTSALWYPRPSSASTTGPGKEMGSRTPGRKLTWEREEEGAPRATRLAWTSASAERQLQREAAEALVGLKDSSQAPCLTPSVPTNSSWISLLHPAPAGGRGFQPVGPSLRPSPAPSVALHIGHLGSISLLS
ncbi:Doublesex- and mab-3-related transcription factor C2 [Myotis davidii]|uniref:Doublesex-and mab-3-related transcription factor C2 n=1 Tax=Myotis davidii TaxID=225400 RepID=L5M3M4_MYODS|nr:Doublesex- and mab-3-related transcription factor C2 [Myotis davidii]